jgi:hypothetical protein
MAGERKISYLKLDDPRPLRSRIAAIDSSLNLGEITPRTFNKPNGEGFEAYVIPVSKERTILARQMPEEEAKHYLLKWRVSLFKEEPDENLEQRNIRLREELIRIGNVHYLTGCADSWVARQIVNMARGARKTQQLAA